MHFSIIASLRRRLGPVQPWLLALLSALLLELPFPLAGPMPPWRSLFAWLALVPLLVALSVQARAQRPLRQGFLVAYVCGVLWYVGNCYWVRDTMMQYGGMPPLAPELLLLAYGLILGAYFGFFGLCFVAVERRAGRGVALAAAPLLWTAFELASSRITSVPWDQLGYSQVDNALVNRLAPWTGVYGISFVVMISNVLLAAAVLLAGRRGRVRCAACGAVLVALAALGLTVRPPRPAPRATAVLVQPNLDVAGVGLWTGPGEWEQHRDRFALLAARLCGPYIDGIPQTGAQVEQSACPPATVAPDLVVWPESPAPYFETDPRFQSALASLTGAMRAPFVVGSIGVDRAEGDQEPREYNSALVIAADGVRLGRYDKIHLVPFGEYVPFEKFLFFARKLTGKVSRFDRGQERKTFVIGGHRYGVFICYEAVFADEVRRFAKSGAEVFVNISDDGWYGDTSAPWQHLNMARMRAIENRRWVVRSTNNGVTASIDPYGRVRQSIPRKAENSLAAGYGFGQKVTFYTAHGDLFAWLCAILSTGLLGWSLRRRA